MPASTASTISIACRAPMVGPPPTGTIRRSTFPSAASCASRRAFCPRSPRCATRISPNRNANSVFGPRSVPAASSCSEAIAEHLADRRLVRARGRAQHRGSPPIAPTPLWSRCSWVTRTSRRTRPRWPGTPAHARARRSGARSSNGSMKTVVSPSVEPERGLSVPLKLHAAPRARPCAAAGDGRRRARRGRRGMRPPRISDAAAAIRHATIANTNAAWSPSRNGPRSASGRTSGRSATAWSCADSPASTCGPSRCSIGL